MSQPKNSIMSIHCVECRFSVVHIAYLFYLTEACLSFRSGVILWVCYISVWGDEAGIMSETDKTFLSTGNYNVRNIWVVSDDCFMIYKPVWKFYSAPEKTPMTALEVYCVLISFGFKKYWPKWKFCNPIWNSNSDEVWGSLMCEFSVVNKTKALDKPSLSMTLRMSC